MSIPKRRAALLPSVGDPFVLLHWMQYFEKVWHSEVDTLYISIQSRIGYDVFNEIISTIRKDDNIAWNKVKLLYAEWSADHGKNIDTMLTLCEEEFVLLLEEDAIIHKPGAVKEAFEMLERGETDVIGSPRGSCSMWIYNKASEKFNLSYEGAGDQGPNFWPCYLYTSKKILLSTDRNFAAKQWKEGETLLGEVLPEMVVGDTFVNTSLQLREMGLRIHTIPQYHCLPSDLDNPVKGDWTIHNKASRYMHIGSLSSSVGMVWNAGKIVATSPDDKVELLRRIAWCQRSLEAILIRFPNIRPAYVEKYKQGIISSLQQMGSDSAYLKRWQEFYKNHIGW